MSMKFSILWFEDNEEWYETNKENLEEYGVAAPIYTEVCREFDIRLENGCYPASLKETLRQKERFPKERIEKQKELGFLEKTEKKKDFDSYGGSLSDSLFYAMSAGICSSIATAVS